jgi:CheY-like chemotaxis protein
MRPAAADSATAAVAMLRSARAAHEPFALVLLDANMPDVDGFSVARQIRDEPDLAAPTVMMLSSSGHYSESARCRDLGITHHLTKPVDQRELLHAISRAVACEQPVKGVLPSSMLPVDLPDRRLSVLLAEDNVVNQRLAASLLERRGHRITIAANGREAIETLAQRPFDVVLMDVQMPVMGGFEATAAIREREQAHGLARIPIVAMTAHAMKGDRERCLAAGMDEYLTKPLDSRRLCAVVEAIADARPCSGCVEAPTLPDEVLARVGGDRDLLVEISRLFLDDAPRHLAAMRAAIDAGDAEGLCRAAHALKGAAANFDARSVVDAARALEDIGRRAALDTAAGAWTTLSRETDQLVETLQRVCAAGR